MATFAAAIPFVLENEGGFQKNPKDSGNYDEAGNLLGTNFGITAKVARANGWTGAMEDLPLSYAVGIYQREYWTPLMDQIQSSAVAAKILDFRVNFGQGGGTILAQRAANQFEGIDIAVDGGLGPQTIQAINSIDPDQYLQALVEEASNQYRAIAEAEPEKETFLPSWLVRVVKIPANNPGTSAGVLLLLLGGAFLALRGR